MCRLIPATFSSLNKLLLLFYLKYVFTYVVVLLPTCFNSINFGIKVFAVKTSFSNVSARGLHLRPPIEPNTFSKYGLSKNIVKRKKHWQSYFLN